MNTSGSTNERGNMKCDNCHEITETQKVKSGFYKTENRCGFCRGHECSICHERATFEYGFSIDGPSGEVFVCFDDVIQWAAGVRILQMGEVASTMDANDENIGSIANVFDIHFGDVKGQLKSLTVRKS